MYQSFFKKIKRKSILKTLKDALIIALIGLNTVFGFPIDLIVKTMSEHLGGRLPSPVATAHATSDTYDFSDCGSTCDTDTGWWASADDVDVYPFAGTAANRNTHTELADANFTSLATSDDSRYAAASPGTGDQLFMWFEMTVTPAADSIQQLTFTFEGHPNTTTTNFSIWLKNDSGAYETNSSWTQVVAATSITADTDATITGSVTTNIEDYIDSNGKVIWAVYEAASAITIDVDYVKMDITYAPLEQEGFRFRNDDGSETTATWLDAQDTNVTQPNQTNTRLRMLVNASGGDPTSNQYQLEYKLSSESRYQVAEDPTISTSTPTVQSRSTGASSAADTTSHAITMPSGITAGDLLILVFSADGARDSRIDSGDWVKLDEGVNSTIVTGTVFYKFAVGSDTATVTTSAAEQSSHVVLRISGAGVPLSASANGSSTNSNPPTLDTNVSENYLWIATRSGDSTTVATAAPSGFSNLQSQAAAGTSGASTNTAELAATASSEDPGTFTSNTEQWVSFTIAVPASGMGIKSVGAPAAGTTTVHIPYPSNDISTGDLLILPLVNKFPANAPSTPAGWTAPSNNQASGGSGANAADTGSVYTTVFTRIADGTESGYVSVAVTSGDVTLGRILVVKKEPGKVWNIALVNGSDSSAGTTWSVTAGSDPGITAGDIVLVASGINTDANTYADHAVTATSVTFLSGGEGEVFESGSNTGSDVKLNMSVAQALSGTSSAAPVFTMTASGSLTDAPTGSSVFIRVRQDTAPIQLVASSNISAGGSATTFQLTAPSGKSTSDFLAGRMQDDENPADAVDLSSSQYTELEWSLTATSVTANGEIYQFRVTVFGAPFDIYSLTPQWTIGTAGTADVQQIHTRWRNDDGGEGTTGWYDVNWSYRKKFTIDNTDVIGSSNLTNFPVLISYTSTDLKDTSNSGHVGQSDGGDIVFTNAAGTKLDHEITKYVPSTGQVIAWVEVDTLDYDTDTEIYLYYGYAAASDQWNITGTWSNGYAMVHHFNETSGAHLDATSNNNDSTTVSVTTQGTATAQIDGADDFNGSSNYIAVADHNSLDLSTLTISGWFSIDTFPGASQYDDLLDKGSYFLEVTGSDEFDCGVFDGSYSEHASTTANLSTGTYYYLACAIDDSGNTARLYKNATEVLSEAEAKTANTNTTAIGLMALSGNIGQQVDGRADEIVISNVARSADWLNTEYYNQSNPGIGGFLTSIGSEESVATGATWAEAEDTLLADVAVGATYRLRLELSNEGTADSSSLTYQIQVAETGTCSSGTFVAIPTDSSGDWQITASTHFTDGDATTNVASGLTDANTTFVAGQIKDTGNTTSGITLTTTQFTEVEYSIAATSNATAGGNYCFRVSNADTYTVYAQASIVASASTFTLSSYRWYVDSDNENVTDPWGNTNIAEDTMLALVPATNVAPVSADELRLRVALTIGTANLSTTSLQLKLQYKAGTDATCTTGSWTDVGVGGGGEVWRYATSSVSDGSTLSTSKLTVSDVLGVYAKSSPTTSNPNGANIGQDIEYDFHIQHNGASNASTYSFKVVKSDGTALGTYTNCPTLVTAQSTDQEMRGGNLFVDEVEQGFVRAD